MHVDATYIVEVHEEDGFWAEVQELPGCFASGDTMEELWKALTEAISIYLSLPGSPIDAKMTEVRWRPEHRNEYRVLVSQ